MILFNESDTKNVDPFIDQNNNKKKIRMIIIKTTCSNRIKEDNKTLKKLRAIDKTKSHCSSQGLE